MASEHRYGAGDAVEGGRHLTQLDRTGVQGDLTGAHAEVALAQAGSDRRRAELTHRTGFGGCAPRNRAGGAVRSGLRRWQTADFW